MANKSLTLDLLARNEDAKRKIEQIREEYKRLKAEVDAGHLDIDAKGLARSRDAQIRAVTKDLFAYAAEADKAKDKSEGLNNSLKDLGTTLLDLASGGLSGGKGFGEMNMFEKIGTGLSAATGLAEPAVAGLTVITAALGSSLVSAGLGLGVFDLAAFSAFKQVSAADTAGTKLHGSLGELQSGLAKASSEFNAFGKAAAPGVADVFAHALKLIPEALRAAQPFLAPTEKALDGILNSMGKGMDSSGFKNFMAVFSKDSGKDLTSILGGLGHFLGGIMGVFHAFMPESINVANGFDNMMKRFQKWGTTLGGHSGFKDLMAEATQEGPKMASALKNIGSAVKNLVGDMAGMTTMSNSTLLWDMLNPLTGLIKLLSSNPKLVDIALWGYAAYSGLHKVVGLKNDITNTWTEISKMGPELVKMGTAMKLLTVTEVEGEEAQVGFNMALLASPITWIVAGLVLLGVGIYELTKHSKAFRDFWIDAWKDIQHIAAVAFDWVKHNWPLIGAILIGPIAVAALEIYKHWNAISHGASVMWHDIAGFFARLPKILLGYVADYNNLLLDAGKWLIDGLIKGVEGEAGRLWSYVGNIGGKISSVFKSALSIFSPSRVFADHGKNIVLGLVQGIDGYSHLAETSVRNLAQKAINASGARFPGMAGGASSSAALTAEWIGGAGADREFITWLKKNIRINGGNPAVLGR